MKSERLHILKMLEEGKITSDEAIKLLESVDDSEQLQPVKKKSLRIKVTEQGGEVVNVNVPLGLAKMAVGMATKYGVDSHDIDVQTILDAIENGVEGQIVEVTKGNRRVELLIE